MDNNELKPCPFCGRKPWFESKENKDLNTMYCIQCLHCDDTEDFIVGTDWYDTKEEARRIWNRRYGTEDVVAKSDYTSMFNKYITAVAERDMAVRLLDKIMEKVKI